LEHDTHLSAHPGINSMKVQVRRKYYWHSMDEDIEEYVKSCIGCQLSKAQMSKHHASMAHRTTSQIFSCFSMDLLDMSSISKHYRYILVLMDYYSGFLLLTPLRNKKSPMILKVLWDCLTLFGPPEQILTDNGTEFVNELVKQLTESNGIEHVITYPYTPQGNAKNERSHRQIRQALRIFAAKHPNRWHRYVKKLQYALNTRPNESTLLTAYDILFGMKPRTLLDNSVLEDYNPETMRLIRRDIKNLVDQATKEKQFRASKIPPLPIERGSQVLVLRAKPGSKTLLPASGPFNVKRILGNTGLIIQHPTTKNIYRVSRRLVRPFHVRKRGGGLPVTEAETFDEEVESEEVKETAEEDEELEEELNRKESLMTEDANNEKSKPRKRPRIDKARFKEAKKLKAHNPRTPVVRFKAEVGHFAIIKQDSAARLGRIAEIIGNEDDSVKVQWYGTMSDKETPRKRWKWYPGYEKETGEVEFKEEHDETTRPAYCDILQTDIILTFPKLSIAHTLPLEVIEEVVDYTLT